MRGTRCLRGVAILGVALGGLVAPASISGPFGISVAKAEKFYTRKRVNGQWITGLFPADDTAPTRHAARPRSAARPKPAVLAGLGAGAIAAVSADAERAPEAAAQSTPTRTEWASVPATQALPTIAPAVAETRSADNTGQPPAADERLSRLRSALLQRAQDLAAKTPDLGLPAPAGDATPSAARAGPDAGRLEAVSATKRPDALEPRSVSFDFESGVKTTVFANSVVREPFDVASMRRITAAAR